MPKTKKEPAKKMTEHPIVLGRGGDGKLVEMTLKEMNSTLISGCPGAGKSVLLQNIMEQARDQAQVWVVDLKRVSHICMRDKENINIVTDVNDAARLFRKLSDMMEARYQWMEQEGISECEGNRILVIVDEFAELTQYADQTTLDQIRRILSLGRACNFSLIVATQQASRRILSGALLDLFGTRIGLRQTSAYASRISIEARGCERLSNYQALVRDPNGFMKQIQLMPPISEETKTIDPNGFLSLED